LKRVGRCGFATSFEVVQRIPQVTKELLTAVVVRDCAPHLTREHVNGHAFPRHHQHFFVETSEQSHGRLFQERRYRHAKGLGKAFQRRQGRRLRLSFDLRHINSVKLGTLRQAP
jgi:hypothetical protein